MTDNPDDARKILVAVISLVTVIGGAALTLFLVFRYRRKAFEQWRNLADFNNAFVFSGTELFEYQLEGTLDGIKVMCKLVKLNGTDGGIETLFKATLPVVPSGNLVMLPETLSAKLLKVFGGQDIQIGDPEFDKKVILRCELETSARELLSNQQLRSRYLAALKKESTLSVFGGEVKVTHSGTANEPVKMMAAFETVAAMAKMLSQAVRPAR